MAPTQVELPSVRSGVASLTVAGTGRMRRWHRWLSSGRPLVAPSLDYPVGLHRGLATVRRAQR